MGVVVAVVSWTLRTKQEENQSSLITGPVLKLYGQCWFISCPAHSMMGAGRTSEYRLEGQLERQLWSRRKVVVLPPVFSTVPRPGKRRAPPTRPRPHLQVSSRSPNTLPLTDSTGTREAEEGGARTSDLRELSRFEKINFFSPEEIWKLCHYEGGSATSK